MFRRRRRQRSEHAERDRKSLEEWCAGLVDEAPAHVLYVVGEGHESEWNASADYDSVDMGLELVMRSGATFGLQWDYGPDDVFCMTVVEGEIDVIHGLPRLDVSASPGWSPLIGRTITACRVIWKPIGKRTVTPQTIRLDFEGGDRVLVTASDLDAGWSWGAYHVTVFFGNAWERRSDLTRDIHPSLT